MAKGIIRCLPNLEGSKKRWQNDPNKEKFEFLARYGKNKKRKVFFNSSPLIKYTPKIAELAAARDC